MTETTMYIGGLLEKVTVGNSIDWRHYIRVGSQTIAVMSRLETGTNTTRYMLEDHQGSVANILDGTTSYVKESFTAFGARRDPATWSGPCPDLEKIAGVSRMGYTGHEAIGGVSMGLNHMNGRVQDAITGRFLSPDPYITEPGNTQGYNRYSYVMNNPMSFTDPSGFSTADSGHPNSCVDNSPLCRVYEIRDVFDRVNILNIINDYMARFASTGYNFNGLLPGPPGFVPTTSAADPEPAPTPPPPVDSRPSRINPGTMGSEPHEQKPTQCTFAPMFAGGNNFRIGDGYGPRVHPITGETGRIHSGIDILAPQGTTWLSPINGTVVVADFLKGSGGGTVVVQGRAADSSYRIGGQHLSAIVVASGQIVNRGDALASTGGRPGTLGAGGSTGSHLHFYVRAAGQMVDPTSCYTGAK